MNGNDIATNWIYSFVMLLHIAKSHLKKKTFQEMYINVGMATVKNDPNKNGMTYTSHTCHPYILFFYFVILKCDMYVFRTQVVCAVGVGSKLLRGGSPVNACVG